MATLLLRFALPLLLGSTLAAAVAASEYMNDREDEKVRPPEEAWKERRVALPPVPPADAFVPIDHVAVGTEYRYGLDPGSLSFLTDGVTRYTVRVESPAGAANVFYEGIRCETKEFRTYGYATSDGQFRERPATPWRDLYTVGPMAYRNLLADQYLCDKLGWPLPIAEIMKRLRQHDPRRVQARPRPPGTGTP